MKSALSLTLIVCLVGSALPVAAQAQTQTETTVLFGTRAPATPATAGPVAGAITREAVRLAAAGEPAGGEAVQQSGKPVESNWSRVRTLTPGTEVVVTVKGSQPGGRSFVLADESQLTTLHRFVDQDGRAATRVLLDRAAHHAEYFADIQQAGEFVDRDVRVGPDGVFVAGRKVADLGQFVERIARTDVVEIRTIRTRGSVGGAILGTGAGLFLGVSTMIAIGSTHCQTNHGCQGALVGLAFAGFPVAGGVLGYRASSHKTEDVIYRAP